MNQVWALLKRASAPNFVRAQDSIPNAMNITVSKTGIVY